MKKFPTSEKELLNYIAGKIGCSPEEIPRHSTREIREKTGITKGIYFNEYTGEIEEIDYEGPKDI